jgi:hypothetical protein
MGVGMIRFLVLFVMFSFISSPLLHAQEKPAVTSALQAAGAEDADAMLEKDIDKLDIGSEIGLEEELEEDEFDAADDAESIGVEELHASTH